MNVLVTGARGFIGSNLIKRLEKINNINIIEFNRDSTWKELENRIDSIDFIYHFAGEVRPKSSDEEFKKSNANLTKDLIDLIEKKDKKIPFLMASSIHAKLQKNAYGITKREAEIYLEEYGKQNHVPVWIYRLPHVFGEGCKPNYNSVISTWIYNSIHGKEIVVFDRTIPMTYVYVQDIVDEFIDCLSYNKKDSGTGGYIEPTITYDTTLGEVVDFIDGFKHATNNNASAYDGFQEKLYRTYLHYLHNKKAVLSS